MHYRLRIPSHVPGYDFAIERHARIMDDDYDPITDAVCADDHWAKDHFARVIRKRLDHPECPVGVIVDADEPSAPWPPMTRVKVGASYTVTDRAPEALRRKS